MASSSSAASSAERVEHAALVEARGEGDHAVARDAAVGGLEPGEVGQRRRLADRAAGVGAGGGRREAGRDRRGRAARGAARARASGPRGCAPGRSSWSRSTSPSRTRPCWSCRAAPCRRPASARPPSRRRARRSSTASCDAQVVRMPSVQKMSLCAIGTPVSGPPSPRASRSSARRASASARSAVTVTKALSCGPSRSMRPRKCRVSSRLEKRRALQARGQLGDGQGVQRHGRALTR